MAESHPSAADPAALAAQARQALAFFEAALADRGVLIHLDEDLRRRLLEAAGRVARPDPWQKREFLREARRQHKEQKRAEDERKLSSTGIRKLRREEVFLTPPLLPAPVAPGGDIDAELATPAAAPASPIRAEAADVDAQLANPPAARAPRIRATAADDDDDGAAVADAATAPNAAADAAAAGPAAAPAAPHVVRDERNCYVCKTTFTELHHFYDSLCQRCGDFHFGKRHQTADLRGRVAVVTGARVKIGYQASILLLRAGCRVVATTRFPHDAALRYSREADFAAWRDRLHVHGLDLRHTPSVEAFCHHLDRTLDRLDFLISNACQTVRRPSGFYQHLMDQERAPISALPPGAQQVLRSHEALRLQPAGGDGGGAQSLPVLIEALRQHDAPELSQRPLLAEDLARSGALFPDGKLDQDLQQVDLRAENSWRMPLADVTTVELLEVQLVNAIAPFVLNARLKPLMLRVPSRDKHIVNVSAMEGQFYRSFKTDKHPHTNMAKAALNMMTRTSAKDYMRDGIHMNSVDTGWVTDEDPAAIAARKTEEHGFHPPLDIVDGAARIVDPIFDGFRTGVHVWGQFLKDYAPTHW